MPTFKERLAKAFLGTPKIDYGAENQAYLDELAKQQEFQNLAQRNNLTLDEALAGVMQGRNYSDKNIAQRQQELGIVIPQTPEQVEQANRGLFNAYDTTRQGGLINDLVSGYRENRNNSFNANNLALDENKGLASRIGEGLGTLARVQSNPLARGLMTGGLALALGGSGGEALGYGLGTAAKRQQNLAADKVYRQQLGQLGYSDEDLEQIPGLVTKDIFGGVTSGMRLGNQRMTYRQLAQFDDGVAQMIAKYPEMADEFVPVSFGRDVYSKKQGMAESKMAEINAKTKKTEAETKQVGKPKVNISIRKGGTNSTITHVGGGGGNDRPKKPVDYKNKYGLE